MTLPGWLVPALLFSLSATSAGQAPPRVSTRYGTLLGEFASNRTAAFLGIPFAQPPLGTLRFKPPQPLRSSFGTLTATRQPNQCMQQAMGGPPPGTAPGGGPGGPGIGQNGFQPSGGNPDILPIGGLPPLPSIGGPPPPLGGPNGGGSGGPPAPLSTAPISEDCLYLNVFTPAPRAGANLPVLFFIHGGGFQMGSAEAAMNTEGASSNIAARGVVVVAPQYRLGLFGFFTTGDATAPPNNGLADLIAALQWVQENIRAFGGDPSRVTISGQSAGAMAAGDLLFSPKATGLFSQAQKALKLAALGSGRSSAEATEEASATSASASAGQGQGPQPQRPTPRTSHSTSLRPPTPPEPTRTRTRRRAPWTTWACRISAALLSGNFLVPDAMESNENANRVRPNSAKLSALADCGTLSVDPAAAVHCLQGKTASSLQALNAASIGGMSEFGEGPEWNPVVDGPGGLIPFASRDARSPRPAGVPLLVGTCRDELIFQYYMDLGMGKKQASDFNATLFEQTILNYQAPDFAFAALTEPVRQLFRSLYSKQNGSPINANDYKGWFDALVRMKSGKEFIYGTARLADEWRNLAPQKTFLYSFDFVSPNYRWPTSQGLTFKGAKHGADLDYAAPKARDQSWWGPEDRAMSDVMGAMLTNFVKTGDPNRPTPLPSRWEPLGPSQASPGAASRPKPYYRFDSPGSRMVRGPSYNAEVDLLWNHLLPVTAGGALGGFLPRGYPTQSVRSCTVSIRSGGFPLEAAYIDGGRAQATRITGGPTTVHASGVLLLSSNGGPPSLCRLDGCGPEPISVTCPRAPVVGLAVACTLTTQGFSSVCG